MRVRRERDARTGERQHQPERPCRAVAPGGGHARGAVASIGRGVVEIAPHRVRGDAKRDRDRREQKWPACEGVKRRRGRVTPARGGRHRHDAKRGDRQRDCGVLEREPVLRSRAIQTGTSSIEEGADRGGAGQDRGPGGEGRRTRGEACSKQRGRTERRDGEHPPTDAMRQQPASVAADGPPRRPRRSTRRATSRDRADRPPRRRGRRRRPCAARSWCPRAATAALRRRRRRRPAAPRDRRASRAIASATRDHAMKRPPSAA